jgi:hypothetical protein
MEKSVRRYLTESSCAESVAGPSGSLGLRVTRSNNDEPFMIHPLVYGTALKNTIQECKTPGAVQTRMKIRALVFKRRCGYRCQRRVA